MLLSFIYFFQALKTRFLVFLIIHWSVFSLRKRHLFSMSIKLNHPLKVYFSLSPSILLNTCS